ncbi:MAG: DNA/RNA nuclease SfsA [Clostridiales bacterium]|mgnify:CR=1 FL=1|jgi:sugar fermentation stimulation protein A|nr:DNA/RNA nuclease SfsA [Clostridiales bacterium]
MKYSNIVPGIFLSRDNRFIAKCEVNGVTEIVHVKNTGRCRELLIPGAAVYLEQHDNPLRKTRYSLIAVQKGSMLVNIDSQAPNKVLHEALKEGAGLPGLNGEIVSIKAETVYGNSRFDFYIETKNQKAFIEVKGVTLENQGVAMFPDAPTQRGVKHIEELTAAADEGYLSYVVFVAQMKGICCVMPNDAMHAEFGKALREAQKAGVHILAYDCFVKPDEIIMDEMIEVVL